MKSSRETGYPLLSYDTLQYVPVEVDRTIMKIGPTNDGDMFVSNAC